MDEMFQAFESWYQGRKESWERKGVFVDSAGLGEYGHQYWIKLHSENGLGNIVLYESNGYYWVDLEGGNYDFDVMYQRIGIEFHAINEINTFERELIEHITWNGSIEK